jgi:CHRD domain
MKKKLLACITVAFALAAIPAVSADDSDFRALLIGFQEVPANSTAGKGDFTATIESNGSLSYRLRYSNLEGTTVAAAHIHFGQTGVNGGISTFLCGGGGKPACPPAPATVTGTIVAADIAGPAAQGIAAGEFAELLRAMRLGKSYVNVHTNKFPAGEVRGQIRSSHDSDSEDR